MAQQVINIGTVAGDGTGDTLRDSQRKVNENFSEVYTRYAPNLGLATPTDTPTGTGIAYWDALVAGTYTNFGGVVLAANSRGLIFRNSSGVFSITQSTLDLTVKVNVSDVINTLTSSETTKPLSAAQGKILNEKIAKGITTWTAIVFASGDQVNYLGKDWVSNAATLSTDIPGTSTKWVERLSGYVSAEIGVLPKINTLDSNTLGDWLPNAGVVTSYNTAQNAWTLTINSNGYQGLNMPSAKNPFLINTDYYFEIETRLVSGDSVPMRIGHYTSASTYAVFTPTADWKIIRVKVNSANFSDGIWLFAPNAIYNSVIEIRKIQGYTKQTQLSIIDTRLQAVEANSVLTGADIQGWINTYDVVNLPSGTITVNTQIVVPSGKRIVGVKGKTILQAGASLTNMFLISNVTDVTMENITIKGTAANTTLGGAHNGPFDGVVDTFTAAISETNIGTKSGIKLYQSERIDIKNCSISNFNAYGILSDLCGSTYEYGIKLTDNYISDNYCGLKLADQSEYSSFMGNSFTKNQIGVRCDAGNNLFSNNHLDKNRVGLVMSNGINDSHGTFSACTFNHNTLYGIALNELISGEIFTGCQIWFGHVYVKNSKGVVFNSCLINSVIYADGNKLGGGAWSFINSMMFGSADIVHNYLGNTSNLSLKGNLKADGTSSAGFNN